MWSKAAAVVEACGIGSGDGVDCGAEGGGNSLHGACPTVQDLLDRAERQVDRIGTRRLGGQEEEIAAGSLDPGLQVGVTGSLTCCVLLPQPFSEFV
jgi:hypothetical protein